MNRIISRKEKAAGRAATVAGIIQQPSSYHPDSRPVNQKFPGRRDRTPPMPSSRSAVSADGASLGLLLLLLSANANGLTPREAHKGWGLAERWTERYIATRHPEAI